MFRGLFSVVQQRAADMLLTLFSQRMLIAETAIPRPVDDGVTGIRQFIAGRRRLCLCQIVLKNVCCRGSRRPGRFQREFALKRGTMSDKYKKRACFYKTLAPRLTMI